MQTATISVIQDRVRVLCGLPAFTANTSITTTEILDLVLSSVRKLYGLVKQHDPSAQYMVTSGNITTTANVATVSLASDCSDVIRIAWVRSANDEVELVRATVDEYDAVPAGWGNNAPTYRVQGTATLALYPTPDAAYTLKVHYAGDSSLITTTGSTLTYRENWDDFVVYATCILVRARQEKDASDFIRLFTECTNDIRTQLRRDKFGVPRIRDNRNRVAVDYFGRPVRRTW